jgi:hypothetical protein
LWLGPFHFCLQERKQKKGAINSSRTRKEKATAQTEDNKAHKEVRQSVRKDRRTYIENLIFQKVDIVFYPWIFHGEYLP